MNFEKLREEINNLNIESQEELKNIVDNIDIRPENIDLWIDDIFSDAKTSKQVKELNSQMS